MSTARAGGGQVCALARGDKRTELLGRARRARAQSRKLLLKVGCAHSPRPERASPQGGARARESTALCFGPLRCLGTRRRGRRRGDEPSIRRGGCTAGSGGCGGLRIVLRRKLARLQSFAVKPCAAARESLRLTNFRERHAKQRQTRARPLTLNPTSSSPSGLFASWGSGIANAGWGATGPSVAVAAADARSCRTAPKWSMWRHITPTFISAGPHRARVNVSNRCVEVDVAIALDDARRFLRLHFAHFEVISAVIVRDADLVTDSDARESAQLSLEDCAWVRDLQEVRMLRLKFDKRRFRERNILHCQQPALPRAERCGHTCRCCRAPRAKGVGAPPRA